MSCSEEWRKYCSIAVFSCLQLHYRSLTLSCWQLKVFRYSAWSWKLVSDWGNVSLVCVIKCHLTSPLLPSAVLSCPAVSLCTTKPSLLGVSYFVMSRELKLSQQLAWRLPSFGMWHRAVWYAFTVFGGKSYIHLPDPNLCYLCPCVCFQTQRKITKIIEIIKPLRLKTDLHKV